LSQVPSGEKRVFSARLENFLEGLHEGDTPNSGRFCAFCYNPLPPAFDRCDHCGQGVASRPPLDSIPRDVVAMHSRKQRRESLVVNSFAYFGLGLGLGLFLALVAVNVLWLDKAFWFFVLAMVIFLVGSRLFAAIFGGMIGDEVGFRYANRRLAEDWAAHVAGRESANGEQST
jgi:hypothetical protein